MQSDIAHKIMLSSEYGKINKGFKTGEINLFASGKGRPSHSSMLLEQEFKQNPTYRVCGWFELGIWIYGSGLTQEEAIEDMNTFKMFGKCLSHQVYKIAEKKGAERVYRSI